MFLIIYLFYRIGKLTKLHKWFMWLAKICHSGPKTFWLASEIQTFHNDDYVFTFYNDDYVFTFFLFIFFIYLNNFLIKRKVKIYQKRKYNPTWNTPTPHTRPYIFFIPQFVGNRKPLPLLPPYWSETTKTTATYTIYVENHQNWCHPSSYLPWLSPLSNHITTVGVRRLHHLPNLHHQKRSITDLTVKRFLAPSSDAIVSATTYWDLKS